MYAKILIILVLAILCTGCTDPDLLDLDPYEFENVTPGAPALKKSWDSETQTITISTLDDTPRITIRKISAVPDLCTFEEVLEIKSFVDYDLNKLKDFRARWKKHKGQHDIMKVEWFILKTESYSADADGYKTIQIEETHYDNVTEKYYNVSVNKTVLICNHSEVRYHDVWKPFSPVGKSIQVGQTYTVKIVYHKPAELGNVRIQTIPMFAGIECEELTWWNTSWSHKREIKINNTGGTALSYYQVYVDLSGTPINLTSLRVVNETAGATAPHWQETTSVGNCTKLWFNATSIPASAWLNETYYVYYENLGAAVSSDIGATFIDGWDFESDTIGNVPAGWTEDAAHGSFRVVAGKAVRLTHSSGQGATSENYAQIGTISSNNDRVVEYDCTPRNAADYSYAPIIKDGSAYTSDGVFMALRSGYFAYQTVGGWSNLQAFTKDQKYAVKIHGIDLANDQYDVDIDSVNRGTNIAFRATETQLTHFLICGGGGETCLNDWDNIRIRKVIATEPTVTLGEEESSLIITAYTPSTPLSKTTGDSQLFTVNTSKNSQCRWYINGSLKQTNTTGATRHEYFNSSLHKGYWNFTATANTTDTTSSQTWWVTATDADAFGQDVYADRWMYVTNLNSSNLNLSQFFTLLNPYYLSFYNATGQKTYNYKSGRWEKYADDIIKPGEAAMLRYTSNVTKARTNASGTFGFTLQTGLNHIGHSYNGTRTLSWYNTTIASANLVTIEHQNPVDGTISTFTYGSTANGTVEVLQGFGVEVNVSSDTVISGL